jgi:hypothetical protein
MSIENGSGKASAGRAPAAGMPESESRMAARKGWWYTNNGASFGPVSEAVLQQLANRKTLAPDDLVWSAGADEWKPARSLPWLFPPSAGAATPPPHPLTPRVGEETRPGGHVPSLPTSAHDSAEEKQRPEASMGSGNDVNASGRAAWVLLIVAWVAFLVPVPGTGLFVGLPTNLVAFILSVVAIAQRGTRAGIFQLLSSLILSPIVYLLGSLLFGLMFFSGGVSVGS